jgi:polar amino acid transport system permease protein
VQILHYLSLGYLYQGALVTAEVTGGSFIVGLFGGALLAAVLLTRFPPVTVPIRIFVFITRGTPLLLQLLFVYDVLPLEGIKLSAVQTAILVLGVNTMSFFSEVMRGSVLSLDKGQTMAAQSLGMPPLTVAKSIVIPQAVRVALPQLANQTVVLILASSLASTISVPELTLRSETLSSSTFQVIPVYVASGIMYLVMTTIVSAVQVMLERNLDLDRTPDARRQILRRGPFNMTVLRRAVGQIVGAPVMGQIGQGAVLATAASRGAPATGLDASAAPLAARTQSVTTEHDVPTESKLAKELASELEVSAPADGQPLVSVRGLRKKYGESWALSGVDLDVMPGQVVVVMGSSGCGKSTLLRCIAQLERVDAGAISVAGQRFGTDAQGRRLKGTRLAKARAAAGITMVFQNFELFKHMTALKNITIAPMRVRGQSREDAERHGRHLLFSVGLSSYGDRLPRQLSGGQQQRVAIARALAVRPRLMLLDEPTSALDPTMVHEVLTVLRGLAAAGMTMVVVTHEVRFALDIADQIVFMADGEVVEIGRPEEVLRSPEREATRSFLRLLEV